MIVPIARGISYMHTDGQYTPHLVYWPIHVRGHAWWWIQVLCLLARPMEVLRTWLDLHLMALSDASLTLDEINRSSLLVVLRWVKFWKQIQSPQAVADEIKLTRNISVLIGTGGARIKRWGKIICSTSSCLTMFGLSNLQFTFVSHAWWILLLVRDHKLKKEQQRIGRLIQQT
jgi:hypothetical protein